jgi:hypothetical protein
VAKKKERVVVFTCSNKDMKMTEEESLEILLKVFQNIYDGAMKNQDDNVSANLEKRV